MAWKREETKSRGRTMSSPDVVEMDKEPHLTNPKEEANVGTDSVKMQEQDRKELETDPLIIPIPPKFVHRTLVPTIIRLDCHH